MTANRPGSHGAHGHAIAWILTCTAWTCALPAAACVEPQAVARIAQSIERCGQIVPCIVVAVPGSPGTGAEALVLIDGYRRVAALRRLGRDTASGRAMDAAS